MIYLVSLGAGALTALSPCILPVLPIIAGGSMAEKKSGPVFIVAGMIASLVAMGVAFGSASRIFGFSEEQVRLISAWMLTVFGVSLVVPYFKDKLNSQFQSFGNVAMAASNRFCIGSRKGQFAVGLFLGAAWSPCIGPTLGIAIGLAGTKEGIAQAFAMLAMFGVGLGLPLLGIAYGLRGYIQAGQGRVMRWNRIGMKVLGGAMATIGSLMILGIDKIIEAAFASNLPDWFLRLSSFL